ncbi:MAG: peptidoglycan-binding protein [Ilumatobacteraceae bacterium]
MQRGTNTNNRRVRLMAVLLAGALLVAACSSDDDGTATSTKSSGTAESSPSPVTTAGVTTTTVEPGAPPELTFGFIASNQPLLWDIGFAQQNALALAVEDINAGGGVLGAPVDATTAGSGTGDTVTGAVTKLVADGADALLGPIGSTDAIAAIPAIAGAHSLACSASATLPDLNPSPPQAQLYRTALPDQYTTDQVVQQVLEQRNRVGADAPWKVAIVARGDDYGYSVGGGVAALLQAQGIETTVINYLPTQTSLADQAHAAAAFAPNNIVAITYTEAPRLLDQLVLDGVAASSIIGLDAMFAPSLAQQTFPDDPAKLDGMTVVGVTGDRAFLSRLSALPSGQVMFGAQLYDCAITIALAASAARSAEPAVYGPLLNTVLSGSRPCSTYGDCLAKLSAGETIAYQGQIGSFTFGAGSTPTASRFTIANLANGSFVVARTIDIDLAAEASAQAAELAMATALQTVRIQQALAALGIYSGPIDGQPNDQLTAAIKTLQGQLGVPQTGVWDEATDAAAGDRLGTAGAAVSEATKSIQRALADLGFYDGPIDGRMSAATVAAIRALQAELGVPQTGIVDAATMQAIYARGIQTGTPSPTTTTTTTVAPTTAPPAPAPTEPTTPPPTEAPTTEKATTTEAPAPEPDLPDIVEALTSDPRFSQYVQLLHLAGWEGSVGTLAPITVFAPTNDALNALPAGTLEEVSGDPTALADLLRTTVVPGRYTAADLATATSLTTLAGTTLQVTDGGTKVNGSTVATPAIDAENGIIHPLSSIPAPQPR